MLYDFIDINRNENTLLYEQLYNSIINAVNSEVIKKGERLPSIRKLSDMLNVSRTTVETAYSQLCAEGYITNKPKKGFFVEAEHDFKRQLIQPDVENYSKDGTTIGKQEKIKYDFSGSSIDTQYIDIKFWKRCVKNVLDRHSVIASYSSPQGELSLREVLCEYSQSIRGVKADAGRIIIGAGTQPLLSLLLGLCRDYGSDIAIEKGFFPHGEQIFSDFGFSLSPLRADKNGIILDSSVKSRILFVNSSGSIRGSAPIPINKRMEIIRWAEENDAIIIEDDFNGELRYTSKPVPALQGLCSERVIYIGSFSKLLLPSVRISYMVLPEHIKEIYAARLKFYNQTSSKIEQLALADYIKSGRLERQLRKLRKIYSEKSQLLAECLNKSFGCHAVIEVIETALCVRIKLRTDTDINTLVNAAANKGILTGKYREKNGLKYFYLCFSGMEIDKIPLAVQSLSEAWENFIAVGEKTDTKDKHEQSHD